MALKTRPEIRIAALVCAALGRLLVRNPRASDCLRRLDGRTLVVILSDIDKRVFTVVEQGRIRVVDPHGGEADVSMRGRVVDFVALVRANKRGQPIAAGRIEISGDIAVAQDVQTLLNEVEIDVEETLSGLVGDVPAHHVGRLMRGAGKATKQTLRRLESDLADYLAHELRALPERSDVEEQRRAVFALAEDVDRVAARLQKIVSGRRKS